MALAGRLPAKANMWYGTTATTPDENFFWGGAWHTFVSIEPILRDYSGEIGKMCDTFAQWVIIGAETGNRKDKVVPEKSWLDEIVKTYIESNITVFMKDSLVPIVGEENMFREEQHGKAKKVRNGLIGIIKPLTFVILTFIMKPEVKKPRNRNAKKCVCIR